MKGEIPCPREGHTACVIEDRHMVIIGGWNSDNEIIFNEIYVYDIETSFWRIINKKNGDSISDRESQTATIIKDHIYYFGG